MLRVAVLISGTGSNLLALLEAAADPAFPAEVVVVGADRDASGLQHARDRGIPAFVADYAAHPDRSSWARALSAVLAQYDADLVVLSGLMRLLPAEFVAAHAPALINTHPAYLPEFPGAHGVRDALAAGATRTGASVIVVDNGVDTGPILAQERVDVLPDDTEESLHARIKPVERRLLIDVVRRIADGRLDPAVPDSAA